MNRKEKLPKNVAFLVKKPVNLQQEKTAHIKSLGGCRPDDNDFCDHMGRLSDRSDMKRRILIAITLLILCFLIPESQALAAGDNTSNPIQVIEDQSFSLNLAPSYNYLYYTFTPQNNDLYAIELEGNCTYYVTRYTENWETVNYKWFYEGKDRFLLGQLEKGTTVNFMIVSYQDQLTVTGRINTVTPFSYEVLSDGTASITGFAVKGDIVIPDTVDGYTVTNLAGKLFYGERGITSVYVPDTVIYFGDSRTSVDFDYVFSYCYDLESITVAPENTSYKSVDGVLYTKDGKHLVNYPCARPGERYHTDAEILSCTSFASCINLKYLYLDNSETFWMGYTFYNTPGLTTFYKPGGYSETRALDFMENQGDKDGWCVFRPFDPDLILPARLTAIGSDAFAGIRNVVISVPDSVEWIEPGAFDESVTLYCAEGSAAELYCKENGLNCILK